MATRDMTERGAPNPRSSKQRRMEKVIESAAQYATLDPLARLKIEAGALEDAIMSVEGRNRSSRGKAIAITTERGFVLNQTLGRIRATIEQVEAMVTKDELEAVDNVQ